MRILSRFIIGSVIFLSFLLSASVGYAGPLDETRCCFVPERNSDGTIKRSTTVINAYKRIWPCPVTHLTSGSCVGWSINHNVPLACGGKDEVSNLTWMRNDAKKIQDSYERIVFGGHNMSAGCP